MNIDDKIKDLAKETTARRRCLGCGKDFNSLSQSNRQCARCAVRNSKKVYRQPISLCGVN